MIEFFRPETLDRPVLTPITYVVEQSMKEFGLHFDATRDLGKNASGKRILGKFIFEPRTILIDRSLSNDKRFSFTLAHEFGHLVLHRNVRIKASLRVG